MLPRDVPAHMEGSWMSKLKTWGLEAQPGEKDLSCCSIRHVEVGTTGETALGLAGPRSIAKLRVKSANQARRGAMMDR